MPVSDNILVFSWGGFWHIAGLTAAVSLAWFLSWLGLRGSVSTARRATILTLRAICLVLIAFLLLGPSLEQRKLTPLKSRIAFLVDGTKSMKVDDDGQSRLERVTEFLDSQQVEFSKLQADYDLEAYTFDSRLTPSDPAQLAKSADGERTDITAALSALASRESSGPQTAGNDLAAVVLISDGADTEELGQHSVKSSLPENIQKVIAALASPINTFSVGERKGFVDLAIAEIAFDDFAFIRNAVEVEVTLTSVGLDAITIPIALEQGGRNLTSKIVNVPANSSIDVSLRFVPDVVGKFVYRLSTPVLDGEMIPENNTKSFVTRIIRDKMRVLHVVGRPSWDQRFLREVLKRNPNVDLVSFYILRSTIDAPGVSESELSLIPFPVSQLFGSELDTFDVVIFQNFNHGPYSVGYFLPQIADYMRRGGGFCMIGGDLSFGAGGYGGTYLEEILPVKMQPGPDYRLEEIRPVVTPAGLHHPVLDIGDPSLWERLPPLGSYNQALAVVPGAKIILAHPFERSGAERAPILGLREVGRGRSAAVLTDGSWRWSFMHAAGDGTTKPYYRFWNNLLRWLIRDPALNSVALRSQNARYEPGQKVNLKLQVRGGGHSGKAKIEIQRAPHGEMIERRMVQLDEQGNAEVEIPSPGTGAFIAKVSLADQDSKLQAQDAFVVEGTGVERTRPFPREDILNNLADLSGGMSASVSNGTLADINVNKQDRFRVDASVTRPLIQKWWILAGVIAFFGIEWWLRRRWGFS